MDFFFRLRWLLLVFLVVMTIPAAAVSAATHTVSRGESLYRISGWYGTSINAIKSANRLSHHVIYPGQKLYIPNRKQNTGSTHIVSRGESLYRIAGWYKVGVNSLKAANGLKNNTIYPGQKLYMPKAKKTYQTVNRGNINRSDFDLLARIITAEADSESYITKVAVGAVVLNRVESGTFPGTIPGVIYQVAYGRYQFEPVLNGWINRPASTESLKAARDALNGWDPTGGALYFFERDVTNRYLHAKRVSTVLDSFIFSF